MSEPTRQAIPFDPVGHVDFILPSLRETPAVVGVATVLVGVVVWSACVWWPGRKRAR